jgi:flagellar biosynthesis GTPase FlhF
MGGTGVGKTTVSRLVLRFPPSLLKTAQFMNLLVGAEEGIGHNLRSETSHVNIMCTTYKSCDLVLVDTPGFDDTEKR